MTFAKLVIDLGIRLCTTCNANSSQKWLQLWVKILYVSPRHVNLLNYLNSFFFCYSIEIIYANCLIISFTLFGDIKVFPKGTTSLNIPICDLVGSHWCTPTKIRKRGWKGMKGIKILWWYYDDKETNVPSPTQNEISVSNILMPVWKAPTPNPNYQKEIKKKITNYN